MRRTILVLLPALAGPFITSFADAQQLTGQGTVAMQALVRNRQGKSEKGDVVSVTVGQPAGSKGFTVSVHPEYLEKGKWQPIPTPKTPLGMWYTSGKYGGLRDYVDVDGTSDATMRSIALFVPIVAFAPLVGKECDFRYVVRVWSDDGYQEISGVKLESYRVRVSKAGDEVVVTVVDAKTHATAPGQKSSADVHGTSAIRSFDTATGSWEHPNAKPSAGGGTVRR